MVLNVLIKNKFAKYKQVFEEVLTGLFLSKMRVLGVAHTLELQQTELNYLESKDIMDHTIEVASRNPILFLNSVQDYFAVTFEPEFTRQYR